MEKSLEHIIDGYKKFRESYHDGYNKVYEDLLKHGQSPKVLIIACSDSRVDPAIILNCQPGDLFVVRNVANIVPPNEDDDRTHHGTSAALEFGVTVLNIKHIIVLGHSKCGGITSLFTDTSKTIVSKKFISKWMELAAKPHDDTVEKYSTLSQEEQIDHCTKLSLLQSVKNLETFPWIMDRVDTGELYLHGWYFDLSNGKILAHDKKSNDFVDLKLLTDLG